MIEIQFSLENFKFYYILVWVPSWFIVLLIILNLMVKLSVGARTLTVLKMNNSAGFWELVSRATALNSLRGVKAESKTLFCNKPMV